MSNDLSSQAVNRLSEQSLTNTLKELHYQVTTFGEDAVAVTVVFDDKRRQTVIISSKIETVCGVPIRHIWSPAYQSEKAIPEKLAYQLLSNNHYRKIGSWVLETTKNLVYFSAKVPDNLDAEQLDAIITAVASDADRLEKKIAGEMDLL